jgi:hypothetical protein
MTDIKEHLEALAEEFESRLFDQFWGETGTVPDPTTITFEDLKKQIDAHLAEVAKSGPIHDEWLVVQGEDGGYYGIPHKSLRYDIPFTYKPTFDK